MFSVVVYDVFHNKHDFPVDTIAKAREYAKRIITEGLWFVTGDEEVFYPVHLIVKVVIKSLD